MSNRQRPNRLLTSLSAAVVLIGSIAGVSAFAPASSGAAAAHRPTAGVRACADPRSGYESCFAIVESAPAAAHAPAPMGVSDAPGVPKPTKGIGAKDIQRIYRLDLSRGKGTTVAIVDAFDNPHVERDLAVYRTAFGLRSCTTANGCFRKVDQRGGTKAPHSDPGWGVEIDLDVQAVSATCPNCHILLVEADNNSTRNLGIAENRAVAMGADVVSNSYGGDESGVVRDVGPKYYTHPGVATVVSSGDYGFTTAQFPSVWRTAIAVGGTTVQRTKDGYRQRAWPGASSGCSAWIAKPAWQHDKHCLTRTTSDVSALAANFAEYDTFKVDRAGFGKDGWITVAGTSVAAPLVAGMIGLAGNAAKLGNGAGYIYRHRSALRDITKGSNGIFQSCGGDYLCKAKPGYDGPTGLGTPRGVSAL